MSQNVFKNNKNLYFYKKKAVEFNKEQIYQ